MEPYQDAWGWRLPSPSRKMHTHTDTLIASTSSFVNLSLYPHVLQNPGRHQSYTKVVFGDEHQQTMLDGIILKSPTMQTVAELKGDAFI